MPRILVLGASGYVGSQITHALRRTGQHTVYGLTRSSGSVAKLARDEVVPVVCPDPANHPQELVEAIGAHAIDAVIDCTSAKGDSAKILDTIVGVAKQRAQDKVGRHPRLGYIYLSGFWVHGETAGEASDLDPVGLPTSRAKPLDLVSWRPEVERQVLASRDWLDVMVLRPAVIYGRTSNIWTAFYKPIYDDVTAGKTTVQVPVKPTARTGLVHVDDVAEAVSAAVVRLPSLAGTGVYPVFNLSSSTENTKDVLEAFARVVAAKHTTSGASPHLEFVGPGDNAFLAALGSSVQTSSARARLYLDWKPKRIGLVQEMDLYAHAWEAGQ